MRPVAIAGRPVGPGHPCFVIAEAGVNHDGDPETALELVDVAAEAGADAVKFQTFSADRLVTPDAPKAAYQQETTGAGEGQYAMLRRLELDAQAHRRIVDHCRKRGILFLSSPFDAQAADLLKGLDVPAFKLGSGEVTNLPFLQHVAAKGRPVILSTGMASMDEVAAAVAAIREAGDPPLVLLHCVSRYPTPPADCNLRAMATLAAAFEVPVGWSDHTEGPEVALAAVALGACVVEKHFTLDRGRPGPDHRASMEPAELTALVAGLRAVERALGDGLKQPTAGEAEVAAAARRSLVAARDLAAGETLAAADVVLRRPGTGLPPGRLPDVLGRRLTRDVPAGTLLDPEMLA